MCLPTGVITEASTALAGSDYNSENRVVDFVPGDTQESIEITIIDDDVPDEEETFLVRLSDPSGGVLGNPSAAVVNINEGAAPSSSGKGKRPLRVGNSLPLSIIKSCKVGLDKSCGKIQALALHLLYSILSYINISKHLRVLYRLSHSHGCHRC